jgi:ammonia channel protein AmtB
MQNYINVFCFVFQQKLGWQFIGLLAIAGWTAVLSSLLFGILKVIGILRVTRDEEQKGI